MLPADVTRKAELRATVKLYLGNFCLEKLTILIERLVSNEFPDVPIFKQKDFEFSDLRIKVEWPEFIDFQSAEDAETLKGQALNHFAQTLIYCRSIAKDQKVSDEHANVLLQLAKVYKVFSMLQPLLNENKPSLLWECLRNRLRILMPALSRSCDESSELQFDINYQTSEVSH